jgi:hypothetical protein
VRGSKAEQPFFKYLQREYRGGGAAPGIVVGQQDAHVLDRGD